MSRRQRAQPSERALTALLHRLVFQTALGIAWRRLEKYGRILSDAEREDIAQEAMIHAVRSAGRYDAARGTLEAWFSAIVRHKAQDHLRRCGRQSAVLVEELPIDMPYDAPSPEEHVSDMQLVQLAELALSFLPPEERRPVVLHEIEGLPFAEIAEREDVSVSTAFERYQRGMAKIRARIAEPRLRGAAIPPPEVAERIWRRVASRLGLEDLPELEPPPSGTRVREPGPEVRPSSPHASRARFLWARRLGPVVALLLGIPGPWPARSSAPSREEPIATAEPPPVAGPGPLPEPAAPSTQTPPAPASAPRGAAFRHPSEVRPDLESAILNHAREALQKGNLPATLAALAEHARLFPGARGSVRRAGLWPKVCAYYRAARPGREVAELEARCAARL